MVEQKIKFFTGNRKELVNLESLFSKTLPQLGFERKGPYEFIGNKRPVDVHADYYMNGRGDEIVYSFRLEKKGVYSALIDATKAGAGIYSSIFELVSTSFPNLVKRKVGA